MYFRIQKKVSWGKSPTEDKMFKVELLEQKVVTFFSINKPKLPPVELYS